jgi:DNA-binding NtrC family response regulator
LSKIEETARVEHVEILRGGVLQHPDGRSVPVGAEPVTVGRSETSTLRIDDRRVSALHCELCATPLGVVLRDLDSLNRTLVGQVAVTEGILFGPCTLRVGGTELTFTPTSAPIAQDVPSAISSFGPLLGGAPPMRRLYRLLETVAKTELSVLITGETGTGKEVVSAALHGASKRRGGPLIVIDCGALPSGLAESVLFGHERGAFTGATSRVDGAFLAARGGTVFLDELGELPVDLQPKLLRAVAERSVKRVGATHYEPTDVRVIAATRRDLRRDMNAARFREDLYFRIAQVRIDLPPLRERLEDVPLLAAAACQRVGRPEATERVTSYLMARFSNYDWPGNVRELVNVASVLASVGDDLAEGMLPTEDLHSSPSEPPIEEVGAEQFVAAKRRFEQGYFQRMMDATEGNISEIARRCGLARHQVRAHLRKLGLVG